MMGKTPEPVKADAHGPVTAAQSSPAFSARVVDWQRVHGRHGLPWQGTGDPYRVWLSEIMLQQTQVSTVLPYYRRFVQEFPTVHALAAADDARVMSLWAGLGYYARARNLLACARAVVKEHGGVFPQTVAALAALPGIGLSTAGAVLSLSGKGAAPILDGNVRRVFARCFGIFGHTALPAVQTQMWAIAHAELPGADDVMAYNQGLMDLGATVCVRSRPACGACPLQDICVARRENLTTVLPTPKPPPVRRTEHYELLLRTGSQGIWVEERPARGIWGGLWMVPMRLLEGHEIPDRAPDLVHELTHRRYCLYASLESGGGGGENGGNGHSPGHHPEKQGESNEGRWLPLPLSDDAPVPAALQRLMTGLTGTGINWPVPPGDAAV